MKYAGLLRIKNEARWIERVLRSMFPLCERIFILDDHSTDATPEIASSFDQVTVFDSPFAGFEEVRDKNWILQKLIESRTNPDYVLCLDGDEELEPEGPEKIRKLTHSGKIEAAMVKICYLWDEPNKIRTDGIYGRFHRPSLFRYDPKRATFVGIYPDRPTVHCTNVPAAFIPQVVWTDVNVLHWGYFDRDLRVRKYHFYNDLDKDNLIEDNYRHVVIGDLFPAESQFRHAGPLKLEPIRL
jgi:glycosyltransferase involved in cell wall biosynthesis